jgi:hypothetical protein
MLLAANLLGKWPKIGLIAAGRGWSQISPSFLNPFPYTVSIVLLVILIVIIIPSVLTCFRVF